MKSIRIKVSASLKAACIKSGIFFALGLLLLDMAYKTWLGLTVGQNKQNCILYTALPEWGFWLYESVFELLLIVIAGIFVAVWLERFFAQYQHWYPKHPVTAFVYASLIPVCSCGVLPLISSLREKIPLRTMITFVVAAPLLNPYIIALSFGMLGTRYALWRIASSFLLAVSSGYIVERFAPIQIATDSGWAGCPLSSGGCAGARADIYTETFRLLQKLLPYLLIAGGLSLAFEFFHPLQFLKMYQFSETILGLVCTIVIGVPLYLCNGADIVFLQPFVQSGGLSMGTAIAFSLTSTSICITSLIMLLKLLGKKPALFLLGNIVLVTFLLGIGINRIEHFWP